MGQESGNRPLLLRNARPPGATATTDVLCESGLITTVGKVGEVPGALEVDAAGGLALPAFIDVHSHADGRAWQPGISAPKAGQGIALEVVGNCGLGPAPSSDDPGWRSIVSGVLIGCPETGPTGTFAAYLEQLQAANTDRWPKLASLLPYGAVRAAVTGLGGDLEGDELVEVRAGIERGLEAGAVGVSLGLVYEPCQSASFEELAFTLEPLARERLVLASHIRGQANTWIEAIDEMLRLAARLDCRLLISHLCVGGGRNQWKADWVIARLREARREGIDVWFDQHPYHAGSTSLTQLLPPWTMRSGPRGIELAVTRDELASLIAAPSVHRGWENYLDLVGPERVLLVGAADAPEVAGRTIGELRDEWGTDLAGTLARILEVTRGSSAIVLLELYDEATIARIAAEPYGCFSTDGVHSSLPHPRLYGTYPYAFGRFVRGGQLSELEFVERTSRRPAQILGLRRSCAVAPGAEADLLVVDPERFDHRPDYLAPWAPVTGLRALVMGGRLVHADHAGPDH
jgi:N-acyl-D-aspartate/D-glutamate deacylase